MNRQLRELGRQLKQKIQEAVRNSGYPEYVRCNQCHWVGPVENLRATLISAGETSGKGQMCCPQCRHNTFQELRQPKVVQSELPLSTAWSRRP